MIEMRKILTLLALLVPLTLFAATSDEPLLMDRIVAVVNDDVVTYSELQGEIQIIKAKLASRGADAPMPPEKAIISQALERLILFKLQLQEADRLGIKAPDATVANLIGGIAKRNNMSLLEMRDLMIREGVDFDQYREQIRRQYVLTQLRNKAVLNRIQISKAEVDTFLASEGSKLAGRSAYHLLHILVATPDGASPQQVIAARRKADDLMQKLSDGANFQALAQTSSDGRQALDGGDLGWMEASQVPSVFADAAAEMGRNEVRGPFRSSSGFHIIMLADYKGGGEALVPQTHARHILIRTDEVTSDDDARVRLERLHERLVNGEDFEALARSHSNDTASAINGGDLKWVNPGDFVPEFEEQMSRLKPGELSAPFRTQFGWHIVQVLERRQHDISDNIRRAKAKEALRDRKADEAMELFLRRLHDEAYIERQLEDDL